MKLRNYDWEDESDFQAAFRPRKKNKIKKMKNSSKTKTSEGANSLTDAND